MKFTKLTIAFLSVFFCLVVACGSDGINDGPQNTGCYRAGNTK